MKERGTVLSRSGAAVAVAALLLAAPLAAGAVERGGKLVATSQVKVTSMDPVNGNAYGGTEGVVYLAVYERLVRQNEAGEFVPELAESWELAPDGKSITFKLRQGVTFHDGTPFDAAAAKFNLDRLLDPEEATQAYRLYPDYAGTDIIDDHTIRVNLKNPSSIIMPGLTYKGGLMMSPTAYKELGEDIARHPVGTGPFVFEDWVPGDHVSLKKNPNYWQIGEDGEPLPYLDEIVIRVIAKDSVAVVELQTGRAQLTKRIPAESLEDIRSDTDLELIEAPSAIMYRLYLNMRQPPFDNLKLRQAINYALDRQAMAEAILPGTGYVQPFILLPSEPSYWDYTPYSYDPEKAQQLMNEAGFGDGLDVEFMMINREPDIQIAPAVQAFLQQIGINTEIVSLERLIYVDRATSGNFEIAMAQTNLPLPTAVTWLQQQLASDGPVNRAAWKNAEFDALVAKLAAEMDPAAQEKLLHEIQQIVLDDAGQTFLFAAQSYDGASAKLHGVEYQHEGVWRLTDAWLED
ncbi:MAG: ABC transporter substrate-binding protein [Geminicoccaceae bacterium]